MRAEFTRDAKRRIAIRLISSGSWEAQDWAALSAVVRSGLLGLDEDGKVVEMPPGMQPEPEAPPQRRRRRRRTAIADAVTA